MNLIQKLKMSYMKHLGFYRDPGKPWWPIASWHRIDKPDSCEVEDMVLEPILFALTFREIRKRFK